MVTLLRGAVYRVDLGDAERAHEQRGRRLGVIVSRTDLISPMVTVVPMSTSARPTVFRPVIEIDGQETTLLVDQLRSIDVDYIGKYVAVLNPTDLATLDDTLGRYLGIV